MEQTTNDETEKLWIELARICAVMDTEGGTTECPLCREKMVPEKDVGPGYCEDCTNTLMCRFDAVARRLLLLRGEAKTMSDEQTTNDDLNDHAVERAMRSDAERISEECDALKAMLLEKNKAYGSSALSPVRIFSKADTVEQIRVRIDDKLSRLMRGSAAGEDVVKDLLGYLILLRIATKEQWDKQVHVAASPEVIDEVLAAANEKRSAPEKRPIGWVHVSGIAWFPNPSAEEPREDVGFALTDAEAAEAERAVSEAFDHNIKAPMGDADWGGEVRRKLGIARGHLDGVAQDLEEAGGWEETVKEIRQTMR